MNRLQKIQEYLLANDADAFFVNSVQNITYLTGFRGDSSRLIVSQDKCVLLTDGRYTEQAQNECSKGVEVVKWLNDLRYSHESYRQIYNSLKATKVFFEGDRITYNEYLELEKCGLSILKSKPMVVEGFRMLKSDEEINCLKIASQISDNALTNIIPVINEGISELDVVAELEYQLKKCGAHGLSFETMVLFGERTSLLHGKPENRKLKKGEHILLDFGAEYQGYHADISRLLVLGKADPKQKIIHDIVNKAGLLAAECLKDGISIEEIDRLIRSSIPERYISNFYPGIGHGVGLEIHEQPFIKTQAPGVISENMVLTIEPGLYFPGWGGMRVEDTILIKKNTCEALNTFSRELIEL